MCIRDRLLTISAYPQATGVSRVWLALSNMPRVGASLRHCKGGLHERLQLPATRTSGANHRHSPNVYALSRILDHPPGSDMRLPDLGMRVSLDSGTSYKELRRLWAPAKVRPRITRPVKIPAQGPRTEHCQRPTDRSSARPQERAIRCAKERLGTEPSTGPAPGDLRG